jgi:hypothetical protein
MTYQISWYAKRTPGPGRRAHIGTERFDLFPDTMKKVKALFEEGMEVRILPVKD